MSSTAAARKGPACLAASSSSARCSSSRQVLHIITADPCKSHTLVGRALCEPGCSRLGATAGWHRLGGGSLPENNFLKLRLPLRPMLPRNSRLDSVRSSACRQEGLEHCALEGQAAAGNRACNRPGGSCTRTRRRPLAPHLHGAPPTGHAWPHSRPCCWSLLAKDSEDRSIEAN